MGRFHGSSFVLICRRTKTCCLPTHFSRFSMIPYGMVVLFFLPSYASERNPDEYLNNDLKKSLENRPVVASLQELGRNVVSHMRSLQKMPERVMKFFEHPSVKYAV
jgi:hypothetical protein